MLLPQPKATPKDAPTTAENAPTAAEDAPTELEDAGTGVGLVAQDTVILPATAVLIFFGQTEAELEQEDMDGDNEAVYKAVSSVCD